MVGCSGSYPGPDSAASCYLLQAEHEGRTYSLVVDMGNGALGVLQRYLDLADVDAVALSHLHVDHCIDLTSYHVVRTYRPGGRLPRLPVYGPPGTSERIAAASGFADQLGVDEVFHFVDWVENQPVRMGPFTVTPTRVAHPVETYAMRIEQGGKSSSTPATRGRQRRWSRWRRAQTCSCARRRSSRVWPIRSTCT